MPSSTRENWSRTYVEAPEIFDEFCRAEDPEGRIVRSVLERARLDGRSVLEIGCGTGRYAAEWAPHAERYVAVERVPRLLALARRARAPQGTRPQLVCADAARLPLPDASVDLVIAGWVVINLRLETRRRVLEEALRVARPGPDAGIWLIENHPSGEFQQLRGRRADTEHARLERLVERWGFSVVDVVRTELRFASADRAEQVLGWLCGDDVRRRLGERPRARLTHDVVLLHRPLPAPGR